MFCDNAGVHQNFRILDSHLKGLLDLRIRRFIIAGGRERPGIAIERENVLAAFDLAFGDFESFRRLMRVIDVISNQLVVGIVGDVGFGKRFLLEFRERLCGFVRFGRPVPAPRRVRTDSRHAARQRSVCAAASTASS